MSRKKLKASNKNNFHASEKQYASVSEERRNDDLENSNACFVQFVNELVGYEPVSLITPLLSKDEAFRHFWPILGISNIFFDSMPGRIKRLARSGNWKWAVMEGIQLGQMAVMMALNDAVRARAKARSDGSRNIDKRRRHSEVSQRTADEFVENEYRKYLRLYKPGFCKFWECSAPRVHKELKQIDPLSAATLYRDSHGETFITGRAMQDRIRKLNGQLHASHEIRYKRQALNSKN
jgi:hypothetical protein